MAKTWLRDDGIWVSDKPNRFILGYDKYNKPIYSDSIVKITYKFKDIGLYGYTNIHDMSDIYNQICVRVDIQECSVCKYEYEVIK